LENRRSVLFYRQQNSLVPDASKYSEGIGKARCNRHIRNLAYHLGGYFNVIVLAGSETAALIGGRYPRQWFLAGGLNHLGTSRAGSESLMSKLSIMLLPVRHFWPPDLAGCAVRAAAVRRSQAVRLPTCAVDRAESRRPPPSGDLTRWLVSVADLIANGSKTHCVGSCAGGNHV
jgi:hypothetical protein